MSEESRARALDAAVAAKRLPTYSSAEGLSVVEHATSMLFDPPEVERLLNLADPRAVCGASSSTGPSSTTTSCGADPWQHMGGALRSALAAGSVAGSVVDVPFQCRACGHTCGTEEAWRKHQQRCKAVVGDLPSKSEEGA